VDSSEPTDDLMQVAGLGLIKAVDRFVARQVPFVSFAEPTVTGELKRHSLRPGGQPRTVAASGRLAGHVDEIQYGVDQGPCLDAMRTGEVHYVPDLGAEDRWPGFGTAALGYGCAAPCPPVAGRGRPDRRSEPVYHDR
jgi:hypothetical protein